jgi:hypothetical protein
MSYVIVTELAYLDSLDDFENFCNVFYISKIWLSSWTFRGSKLAILPILSVWPWAWKYWGENTGVTSYRELVKTKYI